ncbi:uncharacterized protein LOC113753697 [Coffea eugenioides]|uniref:uncharacterized protein LOC113753697 n=1 Tax=Coffea eugenioides TaxID=49369 RepID=UPI000F5C8C6A|nr:uncharacterized protein LOC113701726 [Coffea arabica]XP_027153720.1 uncharacterized protein LOC113753697 [Coffea eugenioides]
MAWRGSLSRSLLSNARASTARSSSPSLPRLRPTSSAPLHGQYALSRRLFSSDLLRSGGFLACTQSLLPLHSVVAATRLTSHIAVEARTCCELSQGT